MKSLEYCENYQDVTQRQELSECCLKDGANRLTQCRVAIDFQFVKNTISAKCNEVKHNKSRYACIWFVYF